MKNFFFVTSWLRVKICFLRVHPDSFIQCFWRALREEERPISCRRSGDPSGTFRSLIKQKSSAYPRGRASPKRYNERGLRGMPRTGQAGASESGPSSEGAVPDLSQNEKMMQLAGMFFVS
jgi:hypothetical protein